jgi:4-diphosphocytidyl-2-C-methyl-D-erythritol kinase
MPSYRSPAKINLFLNLRGQRQDGFHEVCFVMQAVALYDTLHLERVPEGRGIQFDCNVPGLTDSPEQNLVVKAYHRFLEVINHPPLGVKVFLEKQIPAQAGLGGGSSDAATMLKAMAELVQSQASVPPAELSALAAALGSDVPFFLGAPTAMAMGRGELITPVSPPLPQLPLVLIKPRRLGISTPQAFQRVREQNTYQTHSAEPILDLLKLGLEGSEFLKRLEPLLHNDFESVLFKHYPLLAEMAARMKGLGVGRPLLCGSGPTMAGFLHADAAPLEAFYQGFPTPDYEVFGTHTVA